MSSFSVLSIAICFLVSLLAMRWVVPGLRRAGVVDVPNARSSHSQTVVRGGGVGPLVGLVIAALVLVVVHASVTSIDALRFVGIGVVLAAVVGFVEDIVGIPVALRAFCQILVGAAVAIPLIVTQGLPGWLAVVVVLWIAGYINVANFMDGINGISGFHGILVGFVFVALGEIYNSGWLVVSGGLIAAAFAGFVIWNVQGKVFLGDVGSYLLGSTVAGIVTIAAIQGVSLVALLGPVAIYLADSGTTLVRRALAGERWFEAHRTHAYQRMTESGWSHLRASLVVTVFSALSSAIGLLSIFSEPGWTVVSIIGIVVVAIGYLQIPRWITNAGPQSAIYTRRVPSETSSNNEPQVAKLVDVPVGFQETWAVIGATGFIGTVVADSLEKAGVTVVRVRAPRLAVSPQAGAEQIVEAIDLSGTELQSLSESLSGCQVVINAAGLAAPDSAATAELFGANALLPCVVARAAASAGARRFVHLSSAAVQGRARVLDESSEVTPFSPYSRAKAVGEQSLAASTEGMGGFETVTLRATSVQGVTRATTANLVRLSRSRVASVAAPGDQKSPVSSAQALAEFVRVIGQHNGAVPNIVLQPWEGMTTKSVLSAGGGKDPRMIPLWLVKFVLGTGYGVTRLLGGRMSGQVRRVEMMWLGQGQVNGWANEVGFVPTPYVREVLRSVREGQLNSVAETD